MKYSINNNQQDQEVNQHQQESRHGYKTSQGKPPYKRNGQTLVISAAKTRHQSTYSSPKSRITKKKKELLATATNPVWATGMPAPEQVSFPKSLDIIEFRYDSLAVEPLLKVLRSACLPATLLGQSDGPHSDHRVVFLQCLSSGLLHVTDVLLSISQQRTQHLTLLFDITTSANTILLTV